MQAGYWRQDAGGVELARLRGAVARAQERSRGGRWSWSLIAGRIVLLLAEPRRDQEEGGGAGLSQLDRLSCCWQRPGEIKRREVKLGSHSRVDCLIAEVFLNG